VIKKDPPISHSKAASIVDFLTGFLGTIHHEGEYGYKYNKHRQWLAGLNNQSLSDLISTDPHGAVSLIKRVNSGLNLLHSTESAALSKALEDHERALNLAKTLAVVLDKGFDEKALEDYFDAVRNLKSDVFTKKMTPPTTWTIASQILFLADPTRFPFVKPRRIKSVFGLMGMKSINKRYSPQLNFNTYIAIREGYKQIQDFIEEHFTNEELAVRDMVSIQTIIFILAGGYGKTPS